MKTLMNLSYRALLHKSAACFLVFCMLFVLPAQVTFATPTNPDVVGGSAGVTQAGNTTNVDVLSSKAVINWDSLDTNQAEILQFLHAGGNFAVLNRVMQGGATQFNGALFGNQGTIIIVNPNGIVFGPTALVQAYSFTASSLDISNTDFMNGVQKFSGDGVGEIANHGNISAQQVALIGKKVLNAGTISSPKGYTIMASGDSVYLVSDGSSVAVEVASVTVPDGSVVDGLGDVINEGTINAANGQIILAAGDTYARAIEGLDTLSLGVDSGVGRVGQFGTVTANGTDGDGGSITMTAADAVVLGDNSITTANAGTNGDGGTVIAYSPDTAIFRDGATVEAKGGSESGNGGFYEISGLEQVEVEGQIDLSAVNGNTGSFLIDPGNITITDASNFNGDNIDGVWSPTIPDNVSRLNIDKLEGYLGGQDVTILTDNGYILFDASRDVYSESEYDLTVDAFSSITFRSGIEFTNPLANVTLNAGTHVTLGDSFGPDASINLGGGSLSINAGKKISINGDGIDLHGGFLEMLSDRTATNWDININSNVIAGSMRIEAGNPELITGSKSNLNVADGVTLTATSGNIEASAREHIKIDGDVVAEQGDISIFADSDQLGRGNVIANGDINAEQGSVAITGRAVSVNTVHAGENLDITGLEKIDGLPVEYPDTYESIGLGGVVDAQGLLSADNGDINLGVKKTDAQFKAEWNENIYPESANYDTENGKILVGNDIDAGGNVTLHNQTEFYAEENQTVTAHTGTVSAESTLTKTSKDGSLYLHAGQDVSLADDVTNTVGGVSVIADNGKISTPGSDALNVAIVGTSDDTAGVGADLPDGTGKAAIILRSNLDLNIGEDARLVANGSYQPTVLDPVTGAVLVSGADDRYGITFLDEDANIGGYDRDKGIPSDIAIYASSQSGNVNIQSTHIIVNNEGKGSGTVVFDAYDTVKMPSIESIQQARISLENSNLFRFRLEVASRVTEWLFQAIDGAKLPYAADSDGAIEDVLGDEYVLRGAGLDNPIITDGRAWVLENPPVGVAAPLAALNIPELKGCPVEMDAAATELSMNTDQLQLLIGNSLATNPNLQPCEACQRLVTSAGILNDADGTRLAAMNEIFNTLAPADAPFTPEIQANIATAFATLSSEDSQYALASEYVNAFVQYVAVIGNDLQAPVGDPVAYALEKHGESMTTSANPNVAAYVMAQAAGGNL